MCLKPQELLVVILYYQTRVGVRSSPWQVKIHWKTEKGQHILHRRCYLCQAEPETMRQEIFEDLIIHDHLVDIELGCRTYYIRPGG